MTSLKVDGISSRTVVEDLRDLFDKYELPIHFFSILYLCQPCSGFVKFSPFICRFGKIGDIYIPREKASGEHRGFAFVRFFDKWVLLLIPFLPLVFLLVILFFLFFLLF